MNLLPVHVIGGAIAIATGFVALYAVKGGTLHRSSGTIFVYVMLVMSLTGAVAAFSHPGKAMNVPALIAVSARCERAAQSSSGTSSSEIARLG